VGRENVTTEVVEGGPGARMDGAGRATGPPMLASVVAVALAVTLDMSYYGVLRTTPLHAV
jgi:hypothetical protein